MKKTLGILVVLGGGFLLLRKISTNTNMRYTGLRPDPKIAYMLIGENSDKGYPIKIVWSDGITTEEYYNETEAAEIIKKAQEDGAKIEENAFPNNNYPAEMD